MPYSSTRTSGAYKSALQAQQIAALQGMGNKGVVSRPNVKRDLAGFDRALKYAEVALEKGPKVQLGTGKEGSGVGIIVDNNEQAAARPGTGAGAAEAVIAAAQRKRDVEKPNSNGLRTRVTTMYVKPGVPRGKRSPFLPVPHYDNPRMSFRAETVDYRLEHWPRCPSGETESRTSACQSCGCARCH